MKSYAKTLSKGTQGFTLIELLVVVAIIGILAAIAVPQLIQAREKAKMGACNDAYTVLNSTILNRMEGYLAVADPIPAQRAIDDTMDEVAAREAQNPRNLQATGYVAVSPSSTFIPAQDDTCTVYFYDGTNLTSSLLPTVVVTQFEGAVRSYRLVLN